MSETPLISIITAAHNASSSIGETIDSVLNQTYQNWEMIIVNDCSTDATAEIVNSYLQKDKRIRILTNETNLGVAETRNVGLKAAKGAYVAFLDSDDIWHKDKLLRHISFMEKEGIAITYSYYWTFSKSVDSPIKIVKCPKKATYKSILKSNYMGCLTVVINKEKVGPISMPHLDHGEDMLTWYDLMKRGFVSHCLPEPLAYYRIGQSSLSSNKKTAAKKQWNIYRVVLGFSFFKSAFYFISYAINGFIKHH